MSEKMSFKAIKMPKKMYMLMKVKIGFIMCDLQQHP